MRKKYLVPIITMILLLLPTLVFAADTSSDKLILDYKPYKVWVDGGDLCMSGEFTNLRDDLAITKLNNFTAIITFNKSDGSQYQFIGSPTKLPMFKIAANGSKKVTFNLGKFDGQFDKWNVDQTYTFSYIKGLSW